MASTWISLNLNYRKLRFVPSATAGLIQAELGAELRATSPVMALGARLFVK